MTRIGLELQVTCWRLSSQSAPAAAGSASEAQSQAEGQRDVNKRHPQRHQLVKQGSFASKAAQSSLRQVLLASLSHRSEGEEGTAKHSRTDVNRLRLEAKRNTDREAALSENLE